MEETHRFSQWLLVNFKFFKHKILQEICKWSNILKQYLINNVHEKLLELDQFIKHGIETLEIKVTKHDFTSFLQVMTILAEIKKRQNQTNNLFQPLREIIDFLKIYNVDISDSIQELVRYLNN